MNPKFFFGFFWSNKLLLFSSDTAFILRGVDVPDDIWWAKDPEDIDNGTFKWALDYDQRNTYKKNDFKEGVEILIKMED